MKETPIIMSGNHPKLILDRIKTQTRRTWGLGKINKNPDVWEYQGLNGLGDHLFYPIGDYPDEFDGIVKCPYGQVGDRLWVRETWATDKIFDAFSAKEIEEAKVATVPLWYKVGDTQIDNPNTTQGRWRSSRFMPRWASRILLEITEVRVERIQEITPQDIWAEGCPTKNMTNAYFKDLWDSLNAKRGYGWEVNPWVWVISFTVIK